MFEIPAIRPEMRYGTPAADQILINRYYVIGYSYFFRQAKWALEIVDPGNVDVPRQGNFRPDYRLPPRFRADLGSYRGTGYDRGHLVASANKNETELQNSETFLLSNMSPQAAELNRDMWRELEEAVRDLDQRDEIHETYVMTGPIFNFDTPIGTTDIGDDKSISIPIPHAFFKSILTEDARGRLYMWSFILPNDGSRGDFENFRVSTSEVEWKSGLDLWSALKGEKIEREQTDIRRLWA